MGQEAKRPPCPSCWWIGAGDQSQLGFDGAGDFDGSGWPHGFVVKSGFQSFFEEATAQIANGILMTTEDSGDFLIGSLGFLRTVEQEQNARPREFSGGSLPGADGAF